MFSDLTALVIGFVIISFSQRNITLEVVTKAYGGFSACRDFSTDLPKQLENPGQLSQSNRKAMLIVFFFYICTCMVGPVDALEFH